MFWSGSFSAPWLMQMLVLVGDDGGTGRLAAPQVANVADAMLALWVSQPPLT
jgi:hypothetical protein